MPTYNSDCNGMGTHEKPRLDNTKTTTHARQNGKDFRNRDDSNLAGQLRILQINVRGSENLRQLELKKLVNDNKVHVILAQETLLGVRSCTYPGFEVITCKCHEKERRCQGLATLVRRDLRAQVTNLDCSAGFRRFRSTTDQLIHFTHSVIDAWQSGSHTVAVFVDLRQVYDRVWRRGLLLKLQRLGVTGKCIGGLKSFSRIGSLKPQ